MKRRIWSPLCLLLGACSTLMPGSEGASGLLAARSESSAPAATGTAESPRDAEKSDVDSRRTGEPGSSFTRFGSKFADTNDDGLPDSRLPDFERGSGAPARKMIYSASYTVMVAALDDAIRALTARVEKLGGYLSQRQDATLTVRVPADKFQILVQAIPELGRIVGESMQANDVTDRYFDLSIRLENAEKSRQRLLALLDKATEMEDILKIEQALRRLTTDIEGLKGQLALMNDRIAFATVTVALKLNAPAAQAAQQRRRSRFAWINMIGVEQDLRRFAP